jgi:O-antigen/teichoic acid export membrane protein
MKKFFSWLNNFLLNNSYTNAFLSQTLRNISVSFFGQVTARVINALALLILVRNISKEEFGSVVLIQSIIIIGSGVFLTGLNWFLVTSLASNKDNLEEQKRITTSSFQVTLIFSAFVGITLLIITSFNPNLFWVNKIISNHVLYLVVGIILMALMNFSNNFFQGKEWFKFAAILTISQSSILLISYLILVYIKMMNIDLVILIIVLAPLVPYLVFNLKFKNYLRLSQFQFSFLIETLKKAKWFIVYSSLGLIAANLDILMMSRYFSLEDVGVYSVASKLYSFFVIGLASIHSVLLPKFSTLKSISQIKTFFYSSLRITVPLAFIISILIFFNAEHIVYLFAGSGFEEAKIPLQILGISIGLSLIFSPSINVLYAVNRIKTIASSGFIIISLLTLGHIFITSRYGAIGCAITTLVSYLLTNLFIFTNVFRLKETEN